MEAVPNLDDLHGGAVRLFLAVTLTAMLAGCGQGSRPGDGPPDAGDTGSETGGDTDTGTAFDTDPGWGSAPGYRMSWAVQAGGEYTGDTLGDQAWSTSLSPDGDVFLAGRHYSATAVFGTGTENEISVDTASEGGLFLARYSAVGVPRWVASIWPTYFEVTRVVGLDDGGAVIAGRIESTPYPGTFGAGEPGEVVLDVACDTCPFLARYREDGTLDWAVSADCHRAGIFGMDVAPDGDLCVSGRFCEWMTIDDGSSEGIALADEGGCDGFAARFGPDGVARWAVAVETGNDCQCYVSFGTLALPDGSCAVGFEYDYWAMVHATDGEAVPLAPPGEGEWGAAVAKYAPQGDLSWVSDLGIEGRLGKGWTKTATMVALEDDVVASGRFNGSILAGDGDEAVPVSAGPEDEDRGLFFARLGGQDGCRLWTRAALGQTEPTIPEDAVWGAATLPDGGFAVGGGFTGRKVFGAGEEHETELVSEYLDCDAFLAAFEGDGSLRWASRVVSHPLWAPNDPTIIPWGELVFGLAVNEAGTIFAAGQFVGKAVFGTDPQDAVEMTSRGSYDIFLMRLDPDGPVPGVN